MNILLQNTYWMGINVLLASIAVLFGWLFFYFQKPLYKTISGIIWFVFIPNTIYMITDIYHIGTQWYKTSWIFRIFLHLQYSVLFIIAIVSFILALYPFERIVRQTQWGKKKGKVDILLICTNIIIGFGVVLGRVQRTNSWYIITNPARVFNDIINIFFSLRLVALVVLFSIICNLVYFTFTKEFIIFFHKIRHHKISTIFFHIFKI